MPVVDEGAAAGPVADEEGAGAAWWVSDDEAAAGPDVDEAGARVALWPTRKMHRRLRPTRNTQALLRGWLTVCQTKTESVKDNRQRRVVFGIFDLDRIQV